MAHKAVGESAQSAPVGGISRPAEVLHLPGHAVHETPSSSDRVILLPRRRIVIALGAAIVALTLLSLAGQVARFFFNHPTVFGLVDFFYLDLENNLPTWFQSANLIFAAVLVGASGYDTRRRGAGFVRHWYLLAIGFAYLSVDEMASIHERLINPMQRVIEPAGIWAPTWVIVGVIGAGAVGFAYLRFLLHLGWPARLQVACAAMLFLGGSIGTEMATAAMFDTTDLNYKNAFQYALMAHLEEFLEMAGLLVFIDFLLRRLEGAPPIRLGVGNT